MLARSLGPALAVALCAVVLPASALAAAPTNDDPANATPLGLGVGAAVAQTTTASTAGAEPGTAAAPTGCARMGRTIWFLVRGNGHAISVATAGSQTDTVVAIYDTANTPTEGNRIACSDNVSAQDNKSLAQVASTVRGNGYLVQVGGKVGTCTISVDSCAPSGNVLVTAQGSPRPANDDRASAQALGTGTPATVDDSGATSESGELLTCGPAPFAATIWFSWIAPAAGTPTFDAGAGSLLTVYPAGGGGALGCGAARVTLANAVAAGDQLLVQVGAPGSDGPSLQEGDVTVQATLAPLAAATPTASPQPTATPSTPVVVPIVVDLDGDGDGVNRPFDCNDANAAIHPGAVDVPQNHVDENCDGVDAPFPKLASTIVGFSSTYERPRYSRFTELRVKAVPAGATVEVSCSGRGCPHGPTTFSRKLARASSSLSVLGSLAKRRLHSGARVEVRVTAPAAVGRVARWQVRPPKVPRRSDLCIQPGARKPTARC